MDNILDLKGRIALITGAGRGIGREIGLYFARHNAGGVIINDIHGSLAEESARIIEQETGCPTLAVQADITKWDEVGRMVEEAKQRFSRIDILVNNAGVPRTSEDDIPENSFFANTSPEDWKPWVDLNLYGILNCSRHILPGMIEQGGGKIVTIISEAARIGEPGMAVYSASKAAAAGFMRALARETARHNINVNCVAIAATVTPTTEKIVARSTEPDREQKVLKKYVIRRRGKPEDIAGAVLFLCSDAAGWVTGQTYPVNGGYSFNL